MGSGRSKSNNNQFTKQQLQEIYDYYHRNNVETVYENNEQTLDHPEILIKKKIEIFVEPRNGKKLYYQTQNPVIQEIDSEKPIVTSENPRYVEFIVCNDNLTNLVERYAINKHQPDHECKANCQCIGSLFDANAKDEDNDNILTSSTKFILPEGEYSPTSDDQTYINGKILFHKNNDTMNKTNNFNGGNCSANFKNHLLDQHHYRNLVVLHLHFQ